MDNPNDPEVIAAWQAHSGLNSKWPCENFKAGWKAAKATSPPQHPQPTTNMNLQRDLATVLNAHGIDSKLNTPDHELAEFLTGILAIMPKGKRPPAVISNPVLCHRCGSPRHSGFHMGQPVCGACAIALLNGQPTVPLESGFDLPPRPKCVECGKESVATMHLKPVCADCMQRAIQPPRFVPTCQWEGCGMPGPNRIQGRTFCFRHYQQTLQA